MSFENSQIVTATNAFVFSVLVSIPPPWKMNEIVLPVARVKRMGRAMTSQLLL